jgi:hypothetical protein
MLCPLGRRARFGLAALVAVTVGGVTFAGVVGAQQAPTASAESACFDQDGPAEFGDGGIVVAILNDSGTPTYDVLIDGVTVAEAVPASGGEAYVYRPYEDGDYQVVVRWMDDDEGIEILDTVVTVGCASPTRPPTTLPPTTLPPGTAPSTTAPGAPSTGPDAAPAEIRLTG